MTVIHTCGRLALAAAMALGLQLSAQAQTASRDTETGQLRAPTADEVKAMSPERAARPVGLVSGKANPQAIRHADGTIQQELDTSTLMYSVARRNADGTISQFCVTGPEAAERIVKGKKAKATLVSKAGKEHNHEVK
jgi:hypothetical protein